MILLNGQLVKQDKFGDNTLKCSLDDIFISGEHPATITWAYDDMSELFTVACINDYLRYQKHKQERVLELPYIPNARQDRYVSNRLFTLRTFCDMINKMDFTKVEVTDPHSNVSTALLLNVEESNIDFSYFKEACVDIDAIMFPDAGAAKKYQENGSLDENYAKLPVIIGNKHRNTEGRVDSYELVNFKDGIKSVLIKDDIVSYGSTFVSAAKALREKGVEHIYLMVTHCEGNIFKGEIFDYVDKVITTDSILDLKNNDYNGYTEEKAKKLFVVEAFRKSM